MSTKNKIAVMISMVFIAMFIASAGCAQKSVPVTSDTSKKELKEPPPPPPSDGIYVNYNIYPIFPGCETEPKNKQSDCTGAKLQEHIYGNLIIPENLNLTDTSYMAIVQFVVNVDGSLSDFELRRDPCEGCGAAALAAVKCLSDLPWWTPALQYGRISKVLYTMPVKFGEK